MSNYEKRDLNEVLKERERIAMLQKDENEPMKLDDAARVKVLSPGMLVFKRFIRNKLAIVGTCLLIAMFVFAFLGPLFYPYGQTQVFYTHEYINADYGSAVVRADFTNYVVDDTLTVDKFVVRSIGTGAATIESEGSSATTITGKDDGLTYTITKLGEGVYTIGVPDLQEIATYEAEKKIGTYLTMNKTLTMLDGSTPEQGLVDAIGGAAAARQTSVDYNGATYTLTSKSKVEYEISMSGAALSYVGAPMDETFETTVLGAIDSGATSVTVGDQTYQLISKAGTVSICEGKGEEVAYVSSNYTFEPMIHGASFSEEFKREALLSLYDDQAFTADGVDYTFEDVDGEMIIKSAEGDVALFTVVAVRDMAGMDAFTPEFKLSITDAVMEMEETGGKAVTLTEKIPSKVTTQNEKGEDILVTATDENGNVIYEDAEITLTRKVGQYRMTCVQKRNLIDLNSAPSSVHWLGTDTDGYDVLARMMYGGRISLMVGFIVVIIEMILGVIMGGIAGYFGGWVDNLVMRLVDIFYCIPSTPLLIIMGSYMDAAKMDTYTRLLWMMAILGVLGWAGVARLVRGQILSLREQEFMVATEATGITVRRRIFRHLVPNVMPQLIVSATMGLGGVILTESTLSFLGLGVKHPLATWGTMINSVTQTNENMIKFTYIWIPVGALICLTVIAFNFVGDGLRDAFDPKMKR